MLALIITRAHEHGWRLAGAIFVVSFGTMTFMSQIESLLFLTTLPAAAVPRFMLAGAITCGLFSPVAVWVLGKLKRAKPDAAPSSSSVPSRSFLLPILGLVLTYEVLYFTFGYFVAWRTPGVPAYYGGVDPGTFAAQLRHVATATPRLLAFQLLRGLLWIGIGATLVRTLRRRRIETGLLTGLAFAVLMTAPLLLPNPFMPEVVRMAHLAEILPSNFLFGGLVGWVLAARSRNVDLRRDPAAHYPQLA